MLSEPEINKRRSAIGSIAKTNGWQFLEYQANIVMVSYSKEDMRINVYLTLMTVATCLKHPKKGKTQLYRRNCDYKIINQIFQNPRLHTGKGYYTKH